MTAAPAPQPDDDLARLWRLADHRAAVPGGDGPEGASPRDERAELARLRAEVARYQREEVGRTFWWPGRELKPEAERFRADLEAGWERAVDREAHEVARHREALRVLDAARFTAPGPAEFPRTLTESLARPRPVQRWLVEGLWGLRHNVSIEALYKTGKTELVASLIGSYADGTPFLGTWPVHAPEGTTAAVWNTEMDSDDFDDYLIGHTSNTDRIVPAHLRHRPVPLLTSPAARKCTVDWLRSAGAGLWVIDSWTRLCAWNGVDPSDNSEVPRLTAALDEIKGEAGVESIGVTAHMPHAARTDRAAERGFGAQAFSAWLDVMVRLTRHEDGTRYLSAEGRKVWVKECQVALMPGGTLRAFAGDRTQHDATTAAYALLALLGSSPGLTQNAMELALADYGRNAVRKALRDLVASGQVYFTPGPNKSHLHYLR